MYEEEFDNITSFMNNILYMRNYIYTKTLE